MSRKEDNGGNDITFVVTTNPLASSAANKKRVRSVAALKSWPERRKKTFEHNQSRLSGSQGGFVLDLPDAAAEPSKPSPTKKRKLAPKASASTASSSKPPEQEAPKPDQPSRKPDEEPLFEKCTRATSDVCNCVHCRAERRYDGQTRQATSSEGKKRTSDGQLKPRSSKRDVAVLTPRSSSRRPVLTLVHNVGRAEPFNQYPVTYRPWFDYVIYYTMNVFGPKGWAALEISNNEGPYWHWYMMQHGLSEPALFYVRLLFATGDLVRLGCMDSRVTYWLQAQTVQAMNEALSDPKRATSDALIFAVAGIAMHESFHGDRNAANTVYRPAHKRMIEMRGGMKALSCPKLIKRLIRCGDTILSKVCGTDRFIEDDDENQNFSLKQHVHMVEGWVPPQGRGLSRRIKISDLLSPEPYTPP